MLLKFIRFIEVFTLNWGKTDWWGGIYCYILSVLAPAKFIIGCKSWWITVWRKYWQWNRGIVNNSEGMSDVNNNEKGIDKFDAWWHLHL